MKLQYCLLSYEIHNKNVSLMFQGDNETSFCNSCLHTVLQEKYENGYSLQNDMNSTVVHDDPYPFADFAPTLSQCFVIVTTGYLMSLSDLLRPSDVQGLNAFAAYFAMPGIICLSLMDADFGDFRWELLAGIFVGKFVLFVAVAACLLLLRGNVGMAGTVALFVVHSNDLPVGNPLMSSLYQYHRPQMMKYLFLVPALTVILFVPVTNIMISLHRERSWHKTEHWRQFVSLTKNPIILSTLAGIALNFAFGGCPPPALHQPIKVAAATIPGLALALLGFSFVRKERYLISSSVVPAMVLLILKMVVTPVLLHTIVKILTEESESTKLLSDFALLYGTISPAVAVFQSGQEFRKPLAVMSVALILTSLFCFPVSYIVARLTIAPVHKLSSYTPQLKRILFWTSCVSIPADVVVWITMTWKKHGHGHGSHFPGCHIIYLVFSQFLTCCGVLFWSLTRQEGWSTYLQMVLYYGGEVSGYLWIGMLATVLIFKRYSSLDEIAFSILSFSALSASIVITAVMCFLIKYNNVKSVLVVGRPRSNFELLQLIVTTILLFVSLTVICVCVMHQFKRRKIKALTDVHCYDNTVFTVQEQVEDLRFSKTIEIPDLAKQSGEKLAESEEARFYYEEVVRDSGCETSLSLGEREWANRLRNLLLVQALVMSVRLIANLFKLAHSKSLEIMIPMEFLQSILFIGQIVVDVIFIMQLIHFGVFLLFIFGVDVRTLTISARKWWRKLRVGADEIPINVSNADEKELSRLCNQFYSFYFRPCFRDLAMERRWRDCVYKDSFWGHQLVDWLISEGICKEDTEAEEMGQKLLTGGVIRHVTERHHFYDAPYLYYFVRKQTNRCE